MARRGARFGRNPRPQQNLTNVIVSIAREMQHQRDQNIMDAWMKGGKFEGKPVTDEMVLAHWKKRMGQVSSDDPMYDAYQNAFMEYEYSIAESKMTLKHAQGKISDKQAASFYLNWSKKVPKNSEFWRILQRDAARLIRQVKARDTGASKKAAEEAYRLKITGWQDKYIKPADYLVDVVRQMAIRGNRPGGGDPMIDPSRGEVWDFDPTDIGPVLSMINSATVLEGTPGQRVAGKAQGGRENVSGARVLYHDPITGEPVTGQSIAAKLKTLDPSFSGVFDHDTLVAYISGKKEGLNKIVAEAEKTGHLTDAKNALRDLETVSELGRQVNAWPIEQDYLDSRDRKQHVLNNPSASAFDIIEADAAHKRNLARFVDDPTIADNDIFRNKLTAELTGNVGVSSLAEDFTGYGNRSGIQNDIAMNEFLVQRATNDIALVTSGAGQWVSGELDAKTGQFIPSIGGTAVGAVRNEDLRYMTGFSTARALTTRDVGGRSMDVYLVGEPIKVAGREPVTGGAIKPDGGTSTTFGTLYTSPDGTQMVEYADGRGNTTFTALADAPWGDSARLEETRDGWELIITPPTGDLTGSGFYQVVDGNKEILIFDPREAVLGTDPARAAIVESGGDPNTDFRSLTLAYWTSDMSRRAGLYELIKDPEFRAKVEQETRLATGMKPQYAEDGLSIIGWEGDASEFNRAQGAQMALVTPGTGAAMIGMSAWFNKSALPAPWTADLYDPIKGGAMDIGALGPSPLKPLATDHLKDTPFSALGGALEIGTLNRVTPNPADIGPSIRMTGQIKTPSPPPSVNANTGFTMPSSTINPSTGFTTPTSSTGAYTPQSTSMNNRTPL